MAKKKRALWNNDKLITTKDIYHEEKIIPAGTIFYAFELDDRPADPTVISGYGANLQIGIRVTTVAPHLSHPDPFSEAMYIPLDYLQLVED